MLLSIAWKNGQRACIVVQQPCPFGVDRERLERGADPYHPGRFRRHWLQPNTHGIARRSAMRSEFLRDAGRLPTLSDEISPIGVIWRKNSTNRGVPVDEFAVGVERQVGELAHRSVEVAGSVAELLAVDAARLERRRQQRLEVRRAAAGVEYLAATISPCSVSRSAPRTEPGGWARIA